MQPKSPRFKSIQSTKNQISNPTTNTKISSFGSFLGEFDSSIIHRVLWTYLTKNKGRKMIQSPLFVQYVLCNVRVLVKDQGFKLFFEESNRHNTGILVAYGIRWIQVFDVTTSTLSFRQATWILKVRKQFHEFHGGKVGRFWSNSSFQLGCSFQCRNFGYRSSTSVISGGIASLTLYHYGRVSDYKLYIPTWFTIYSFP